MADVLRASIGLCACRSPPARPLVMVTLLVAVAVHQRFLVGRSWPFTSPARRQDDLPISTVRIHRHPGLGVHRPCSGTEPWADELASSAAKTGLRTVMTRMVNHCRSGLLDEKDAGSLFTGAPCTVPLPGVSPGIYRTGLTAVSIG